MKTLLLILLFSSASFAMENSLQLDNETLKEFLANKRQMVAVSSSVDPNNLLLKRLAELGELNETAAAQECAKPTIQNKAKLFYARLTAQPEYESALAIAKTVNTKEAWDTFRIGNQKFVAQYFQENGINIPQTKECADFFNRNPKLTSEQIDAVIAQSWVIYYIRNLQRKLTNIAPSPIPIK